jgi:hypothetical protein
MGNVADGKGRQGQECDRFTKTEIELWKGETKEIRKTRGNESYWACMCEVF